MSHVAIDLESKVPPFQQIKASVITMIGERALPTGHQLPPIRQLANDLGVAPNTVARSYRELEADGFVRSRGRRGTVVVGLPTLDVDTTEPIRLAVAEARGQGQSPAQILAAVTQALAAG